MQAIPIAGTLQRMRQAHAATRVGGKLGVGLTAAVALMAIAVGCGANDVTGASDPCAAEIRAAFSETAQLDNAHPKLERIGEGAECGYRRTSPTRPKAAFDHFSTALGQAGWSVTPTTYTNPCAAAPSSPPCGGGPLLTARRGHLQFSLEYENAGEGEAAGGPGYLYIAAMSHT